MIPITWNGQSLRFGVGALDELSDVLQEAGIARPLVVCSPSVRGEVDDGALSGILRGVAVYDGVQPHTPVESVLEACRAFRDHHADGVVALGGGSAMDTAKLVAFEQSTAGGFTRTIVDATIERRDLTTDFPVSPELEGGRVACVNVPTTLSQAEYTQTAGFTLASGGKAIFGHPFLRAAGVIVDPGLAERTPLRLRLATGLKALDTGIAVLAGLPDGDRIARPLAAGAVRLLAAELRRDDDQAGETSIATLQWGAWLAIAPRSLVAFDEPAMVGRWPSAALRHQIGGILGLSHSEAAAALLPALGYTATKRDPWFANELAGVLGVQETGLEETLARLVEACGLSQHLAEVGLRRDDVAAVSEAAAAESSGCLTVTAAEVILRHAL